MYVSSFCYIPITHSPLIHIHSYMKTHIIMLIYKRMLTIFALLTQEALWGFTQTILPECCFKEWI